MWRKPRSSPCAIRGTICFSPHVRWSIAQEDAGGYLAAADFIHEQGFDVVSLQHEFGIYGGEAGDYILGLIGALRIPLVTTLHTVLDQPTDAARGDDGAAGRLGAGGGDGAKGRSILIDCMAPIRTRFWSFPTAFPTCR
jgi:hypothetical protein